MAGRDWSGSAFCSLVKEVFDGLVDRRDDAGVDYSVEAASSVSSPFDPACEAQYARSWPAPALEFLMEWTNVSSEAWRPVVLGFKIRSCTECRRALGWA